MRDGSHARRVLVLCVYVARGRCVSGGYDCVSMLCARTRWCGCVRVGGHVFVMLRVMVR
jgi:hypothetical protein